MRKTILITGTNKGIGLGLVKHYLQAGWQVVATCRDISAAEELQMLAVEYPLSIYELEVAGSASRDRFVDKIKAEVSKIDCLIHNAGVLGVAREGDNSLAAVTEESFMKTLHVNTVAPFLLTQQLLPCLAVSDEALVVGISSFWGSITGNDEPGYYAYRASKAAMNMMMVSIRHELQEQGIRTLCMSPGWVNTDMGSSAAPLSVEDSVAGMAQVIERYKAPTTGDFLSYTGEPLPW